MSANNNFDASIQALFKGMENFMTTKTVVGDAIHIEDTIILPLVDVTFGCAAGANSKETKGDNAAGGMGGKITPSAVLVLQNGNTRLVTLKDANNHIAKLMDVVPEVISKFTDMKGKKDNSSADMSDEKIKETIQKSQEEKKQV